ncbi:concanavalin A-like lectin/glucanase domain-containing protein [Nemania sp. FL0031]|nr:concanavalin A-like lectin/glucanase domain-containing protein [Nemania sp. FL0031]
MNYSVLVVVLVLAQHAAQTNGGNEWTQKWRRLNAKSQSDFPSLPSPTQQKHHHDLLLDYPVSATTSWAGATIDIPRGNASEIDIPAVASVKAQWDIPRLCLRESQNISSAGMLETWIGISGKGCESKGAMVQAGIKAVLQNDGTTTAHAWASWYPAIPYMDIVDFDVRPGDVVTVELTVSDANNGEVHIVNRRTNHSASQPVYSPDPGVGDFSICSTGDGRAWAVVEGPFTPRRDPPDTAIGADGIPVFDDVSFRTLEVSAPGKEKARGLHDGSAMLYVLADDQGIAVNVDALGENGFQLYTTKACVND